MTTYEYKVTPAPLPQGRAGKRAANLASEIEQALNVQAKDGWQFVRMDVLSVETKPWLRRARTQLQSVIVFRREVAQSMPQLVLRPADAVQEKLRENPVTSDIVMDPPRIENAVRGFGRATGAAPSPVMTRPRAPLIAARRS